MERPQQARRIEARNGRNVATERIRGLDKAISRGWIADAGEL